MVRNVNCHVEWHLAMIIVVTKYLAIVYVHTDFMVKLVINHAHYLHMEKIVDIHANVVAKAPKIVIRKYFFFFNLNYFNYFNNRMANANANQVFMVSDVIGIVNPDITVFNAHKNVNVINNFLIKQLTIIINGITLIIFVTL